MVSSKGILNVVNSDAKTLIFFYLYPYLAGHAEKFVDIFQQTQLGKYIASLSEGEKEPLFYCYVRDFLRLAMGVSSDQELIVSITARNY